MTKPGRPPITTKDLPANWQEIILNLSAQGCSDVEIKYELCVSGTGKKIKFHPDLWNALQKRDAEFSETIKIGKILCEGWWRKQGRVSLKCKVFQTGCWYANMKNRFGWRDQKEIPVFVPEEDLEFSKTPGGDLSGGNGKFKRFYN